MGHFYVNFSVKRDDAQRVAEVLKRVGCRAFITPPTNGYVVVFEEESDSQDTQAIEQIGALLSREVDAPVLAILNHDDDVLCYWLFNDERVSDSYNSCPDYFDETEEEQTDAGGDAHHLKEVLSGPSAAEGVDAILRGEYAFAVDRHKELVEALGLPRCAVGLGYRNLERGESPSGLNPDQLIRVG